MKRRFGLVSILLSGLCLLFGASSSWAADYPNRPIKWIVPYPPAGTTDVLARIVAQALSERLGQQVIVENKPGGGNNIGTEFVVNASPDGYTMLLVNPANGINATLYKKLNFNFIRDITPVAGIVRTPNVMVITNNLPVKNVAEFIAYCKANPTKVNMASSGSGTSVHLSGELFKYMTGCQMAHIPYKGGAPAITDTISGQIPLSFSAFGVALTHIKTGKVVALGVTGSARSKLLPEIPTIEEAGNLKGYEMSIVYAVWVPAGVPQPIINRLSKAIEQVVGSNTFKEKVSSDGGETMNLSNLTESNAYFQKEMQRLSKIVKDGNIKSD